MGRQYEPIIRINSQSGKGGAAFIMNHNFGFDLPKAMHRSSAPSSRWRPTGWARSSSPDRIMELFEQEYLKVDAPISWSSTPSTSETVDGHSQVTFFGTIRHKDTVFQVNGEGNGPIDAFFNAIHGQKMDQLTFVDYKSHAITNGSDSVAVAYIQLRDHTGRDIFGVGLSHNINLAPPGHPVRHQPLEAHQPNSANSKTGLRPPPRIAPGGGLRMGGLAIPPTQRGRGGGAGAPPKTQVGPMAAMASTIRNLLSSFMGLNTRSATPRLTQMVVMTEAATK